MSKKDLRPWEYRVGNEDFWTTDSTGIPTFDWPAATGARGDYGEAPPTVSIHRPYYLSPSDDPDVINSPNDPRFIKSLENYSGKNSYDVPKEKLNWIQRALANLGFGK